MKCLLQLSSTLSVGYLFHPLLLVSSTCFIKRGWCSVILRVRFSLLCLIYIIEKIVKDATKIVKDFAPNLTSCVI